MYTYHQQFYILVNHVKICSETWLYVNFILENIVSEDFPLLVFFIVNFNFVDLLNSLLLITEKCKFIGFRDYKKNQNRYGAFCSIICLDCNRVIPM